MGRLLDVGLKLKLKKCCFLQKEINFFGYIVLKNGIRIDLSKIKVVEQVRILFCVKELWSFFGLMGYYRKFVKDYFKIVKFLYDLIKKEKKWVWIIDCQEVFEKLKSKLIFVLILVYLDRDVGEFIFDIDVSVFVIGVVLF